DNGGYEHESTVQPNAAGLLVVPLDDRRAGKVEIAEVRDASRLHWPETQRLQRPYRTTLGREPPPNPPLAVLDFAAPEVAEVIRLAPVTAPDVAPRIHGIVLDAAGKPAAGVRIWITTVSQPEPRPFADFEAKTDAEGKFAIRATELPEEVFVGGRLPLGFCAPQRVRPSPEPITLRLLPTGAVAMDLRMPERPAMPEELARRLRTRIDLRTDESALADGTWMFFRKRSPVFEKGYRDRWGAFAWPPEQGECVLRDLVPGEYRLLGNIGPNGVLDVPGVRVLAGETTRPAAAQGVTIGAGVVANVVRVRDVDGRPLAKVRVWLMLPEWTQALAGPAWQDTDANGEAWFIGPRGALADVEIKTEGRAPVKLHGVPFPVEITLGNGTSLDFAITAIGDVASDSRAVVVGCMPFDGTPPDSPVQEVAGMKMFRHPQANLDAAGRATIPNLPPGHYRLWLGAVPPLRSQRGSTFVLLGDREITAKDPARVLVEHSVTAAETATLLGR
ncbi:MAG: carboxypeptidase regulatory-like domain-containing protein, partial [Planctomycetes bacterium]|nr:carboxypeptidase regulatory-like domain-containing protein [Planctomycetota bacterium]